MFVHRTDGFKWLEEVLQMEGLKGWRPCLPKQLVMNRDRLHHCPDCELTVPVTLQWMGGTCPRCLVNEGKGVAMGVVSPCSAAVAVAAAPR